MYETPDVSKTILIVEDEPFLREVYRAALEAAGFRVEVAEDGREGLERIVRLGPDLVILDLGLPLMRGEEVLAEMTLDSHLQHIPVIVASGDPELPPLAATEILRKPFPVQELVHAVRRVLQVGPPIDAPRLFTRGTQSVRLVREEDVHAIRLLVFGPATAGTAYEFSDVAACQEQEAAIERQLLGEGYKLNPFAADRRRARAVWSGPDRRRETSSDTTTRVS